MQITAVRQIVRPMRLDDIPQVMEVERQSFPTMWPPTAFKRELEGNRLARYLVATQRRADFPTQEGIGDGSSGGIGRILGGLRLAVRGDGHPLPPVEERDELVVGFVGVWLLVDEAHVVTIAVRDGHRGRGLGELLLVAAIETALEERQAVLTLECRISNEVALRLYDKYGFKKMGLRPRYYSDNHEDAYVLTASDIDTPSYVRRFHALRDEHRQRCGDYELQI